MVVLATILKTKIFDNHPHHSYHYLINHSRAVRLKTSSGNWSVQYIETRVVSHLIMISLTLTR